MDNLTNKQTNKQTNNQSINESVNLSINESVDDSINQSAGQPVAHPAAPSLNEASCEQGYSLYLPDAFRRKWQENRRLLLLCLISVFAWGLAAHAYAYFSSAFSHDSLNEFYAGYGVNAWKVQLGRIFVPAYRALIRSDLTMPWVIGLLALCYIAAAVFLVIKIYDIREKWVIVITGGIFTANLSLLALTATYIMDLDSDMLGMFFAVLAVYLWKRYPKGFLMGIVPVCLSLGLYQSNISMTITLIFLYLILGLLKKEKILPVFLNGIRGVIMLVAGGILYLVCMKAVCAATGIEIASGRNNSVDTFTQMGVFDYIYRAIEAFYVSCREMLLPDSLYPQPAILIMSAVILLVCAILVICLFVLNRLRLREIVLCLVLICLLPVMMNVSHILTNGVSNDLMYFAIWLVYLLVLLVARMTFAAGRERLKDAAKNAENTRRKSKQSIRSIRSVRIRGGLACIAVCLVCVILWGNVRTANAAYLKKDLEAEATLSLMTRIADDMEETPGYTAGETQVVFAGDIDEQLQENGVYAQLELIRGLGNTSSLGVAEWYYYQSYFNYILLREVDIADEDVWYAYQDDAYVAAMPCWPEEGSIQIVDGVLVIHLSETEE